MKLGVQLFGCMPLYNANPEAFLTAVKKAGYDQVEPCIGFGGLELPFAWKSAELALHVERAAAHGLAMDSCHVFAPAFWESVPELLDAAGRFGFKRFVVGFIGEPEREALDAFAAHCAETAAALSGRGLELWLHNNAREIAAKIDGVSAYEYILRACNGALGAQVDTGWVACGGESVPDFLARNAGFIRSIHHKDVKALTDAQGRTDNVAVGEGIVDPRPAFDFAVTHGIGQIVDQDNSLGDILADLASAATCLNSLAAERIRALHVAGIGHLAFVCRDLEASVAFYREKLNFKHKFSLTYADQLDMNLKQAELNGEVPDPDMVARLSAKADRTWIAYLEFGGGQFVELFDGSGATIPAVPTWSHLNFNHVALLVDDIFAAEAALRAAEVPLDEAPKLGPDQTWQMWAHDLDGNRIEFMQYTDASWQLCGRPDASR